MPGDLGDGNRPGLGGNRPGIGGNRPTTLPGDLGGLGGGNRPGGGWNRPEGGWNRPEGGWNRPGIGGNRPGWNRPGIGNNNNNIWNSGNNTINNINTGGWGGGWNGGAWGYPGWGGGYGWNHGYVNPHYGNWYNGSWNNGGWNNGWGGFWGGFATGAATWGLASAVTNWGLGYGALGYAGNAYVNPYYSAIPATVVATSPYDYSQPIVVNNYIPVDGGAAAAPVAESAPAAAASDTTVDAALEKFKAGDYAGALAGFDAALKVAPNDSVIHEVRALALFALGRYPEAAATLNAVLASAPGMDWTTVSNLYPSVDVYTAQLRKLEDFCRANPGDAAAHFVLAYQYLVGGHSDAAASALEVVVAKQPGDMVAKRLLGGLKPAAEAAPPATAAPAAPAAPETDLVGVWKAGSGADTITLEITAESKFTWKAAPTGKPAVDLAGTIETAADAIALHSEQAGTMVGKVTSKGPDAFEFSLPGAPAEAKPLLFQRQR